MTLKRQHTQWAKLRQSWEIQPGRSSREFTFTSLLLQCSPAAAGKLVTLHFGSEAKKNNWKSRVTFVGKVKCNASQRRWKAADKANVYRVPVCAHDSFTMLYVTVFTHEWTGDEGAGVEKMERKKNPDISWGVRGGNSASLSVTKSSFLFRAQSPSCAQIDWEDCRSHDSFRHNATQLSGREVSRWTGARRPQVLNVGPGINGLVATAALTTGHAAGPLWSQPADYWQ